MLEKTDIQRHSTYVLDHSGYIVFSNRARAVGSFIGLVQPCALNLMEKNSESGKSASESFNSGEIVLSTLIGRGSTLKYCVTHGFKIVVALNYLITSARTSYD